MEYVEVHIETLKASCLKQGEFNQPVPQNVVDNIKLPSDISTPNGTDSTNETTTKSTEPTSIFVPAIPPDFLSNFKQISCPNDCSGHGKCTAGKTFLSAFYNDF